MSESKCYFRKVTKQEALDMYPGVPTVVCATGHPGDHDLICPSSIDINKELSPERFLLRVGKDSAVPDGFVKVLSIRNIPVKNVDLLNEKFWAVRRYRREPQDEKYRLRKQYEFMKNYSIVLTERIKAF